MLIAPGFGLGVYFFACRYGQAHSLLYRSSAGEYFESLREKIFTGEIPKTLKTMTKIISLRKVKPEPLHLKEIKLA
ncbi:MAG: hypothetical protein AAFR87_22740, partial [Bacteroidota bacterium]